MIIARIRLSFNRVLKINIIAKITKEAVIFLFDFWPEILISEILLTKWRAKILKTNKKIISKKLI
jgi:hypothetical protein